MHLTTARLFAGFQLHAKVRCTHGPRIKVRVTRSYLGGELWARLAQQRVQDGQLLAQVNVAVVLGRPRVLGQGTRDLLEERPHRRSFPLDERVEELHERLLALELGKVGQGLERLGDEGQVSRALLVWELCEHVENHVLISE